MLSELENAASVRFVRLVQTADCPLDVGTESRSAHAVVSPRGPALRGRQNNWSLHGDVDVVDPLNAVSHISHSPMVKEVNMTFGEGSINPAGKIFKVNALKTIGFCTLVTGVAA